MGHIKLLLSKGGSLMRGAVDWVRVVCGEWTGQSWDLRQVLQLELVIVGGMRLDEFIEAGLFVVLWGSNAVLFKFLWCVFPGRVPWLRVWSVFAWAIMIPLTSLWDHLYGLYKLMYAYRERGEVVGWSWCWVSAWKQQGKSMARAELVLVVGLLCLSGDCW